MTTLTDAPSESWLALPAVMTLPGPRTGSSFSSPSSVVSGRLPSSLSSVTSRIETSPVSLSLTAIVAVTGMISSSNLPVRCASAVRCCERSANSSQRSRGIE